ncbi:hypothetical protein [Haloplanus sp. C73]|uniref:hypothetical protein n=1 Tax=Haloplanus sp. C73 TaxID=3421641 RepID=UPI003EBE0659
MPSRRTLLASLGAAVGLAGCLDTSSESPTATPTAETTLGQSVDVDGTTVTVAETAAVHSYQYLSAPDAFGVESAGDGQFLFVGVSAEGERPPPVDAFALRVDDDSISPVDRAGVPERDLAPVGESRYTEANPQGYLLFRVPAPLDAESVGVIWGRDTDLRARWAIPASRLDTLRSPPPEFSVSYDVPEAVGGDDPVPVRVDVTNAGEGAGVCRGAINHTGPMYGGDTFSLSLGSGASETYEETVDYHVEEDFGVDRLQFEVVVPGDSQSFTVRLDG